MTKMSWSLCRDPCSQLLRAGDSDLWLNSYMKVVEFFKPARFLVKIALGTKNPSSESEIIKVRGGGGGGAEFSQRQCIIISKCDMI